LDTEKALGQVPRRLGHLENIQILGPIPAPIAVVRNAHRYHLLIKHEASSSANLKAELRKWLMESRSPLLKAHVDIDPVDLL